MPRPTNPKIYHILHVDKLRSVVSDGELICDASMTARTGGGAGTTIGMTDIKVRRLTLGIECHPGLSVGDCVPFYFCPRSIMLYLLHRADHPDLTFRGGQEPIVHLEADLRASVEWAAEERRRWAFTLSNAGSLYFERRKDLTQLNEVNWAAVQARTWSGSGVLPTVREGKQAEFLMEGNFPWKLIDRIGVYSDGVARQVAAAIRGASHQPVVERRRDWYY